MVFMLPRRRPRKLRLCVAVLAALASLLPVASPSWNPLRDDPFVALAGLCGPGHDRPGSPLLPHDHANCPACQPAAPPLLVPPGPPALPAPVPVALHLPALPPAGLPCRPAPPYASRAPPAATG